MEEEWFFEAITETYVAAPARVRAPRARRHRLPPDDELQPVAPVDDDRRSAQGALRAASSTRSSSSPTRRSTAPGARTARSTSSRRCTATASARSATAGGATTATSCAPSARCRTPGASRSSRAPRRTRSSRCSIATGRRSARRSTRRRASTSASSAGASQGMWLGECGYVPGVDELMREEGIRFFFVDTHGVLFAEPRPLYGVHAPVYCRSGVAAFGRDIESSKQVWSAQEGYPGDPDYRDFYRDIGFDLPFDYIKPYIHPEGIRTFTGLQVLRGHAPRRWHDKRPVRSAPARTCARPSTRATSCSTASGRSSTCARTWTAARSSSRPYDAELFGHWWYEGPMFLELLFRKLQYDQGAVAPITPSGYLREYPTNQVATPSLSSWGEKGYGEYWCNGSNAWVYRHLHKMAERMVELAHRFPDAEGVAAPRARPGGARGHAGAVERLGVHHEDGHDGAVRDQAHERPREALHAHLRAPGRAARRRRGVARRGGARGTTCSPRSTTASTRPDGLHVDVSSRPHPPRRARTAQS